MFTLSLSKVCHLSSGSICPGNPHDAAHPLPLQGTMNTNEEPPCPSAYKGLNPPHPQILHPLHPRKQAAKPNTADLMTAVQIQPTRFIWDTSESKPALE